MNEIDRFEMEQVLLPILCFWSIPWCRLPCRHWNMNYKQSSWRGGRDDLSCFQRQTPARSLGPSSARRGLPLLYPPPQRLGVCDRVSSKLQGTVHMGHFIWGTSSRRNGSGATVGRPPSPHFSFLPLTAGLASSLQPIGQPPCPGEKLPQTVLPLQTVPNGVVSVKAQPLCSAGCVFHDPFGKQQLKRPLAFKI